MEVLIDMDSVRLPNRVMFGGRNWKAAALERGAWDDTIIEGGRRFMAGWRKEKKSAAIIRQRKQTRLSSHRG